MEVVIFLLLILKFTKFHFLPLLDSPVRVSAASRCLFLLLLLLLLARLSVSRLHPPRITSAPLLSPRSRRAERGASETSPQYRVRLPAVCFPARLQVRHRRRRRRHTAAAAPLCAVLKVNLHF